MDPEIEEIDGMVVEGAGGGSHHKEHKQDTRESSISVEGNGDEMIDASNCKENKESNDELRNGVFAGNNANIDSREKTVMGDSSNQGMGEVNDLESLTDGVTLNEKEEIVNDDTKTTKEVLLVPEKKVLRGKKVVKKVVRKKRLVKGKFAAKDEEEPQSLEMSEPSVEVPTNQNVKSKEDVPNNGAALASDEGVNEMLTVSEKDIREQPVMGDSSNQDTREAKDLESPTDAVTRNSKEEIIDDDTDTTNKVLLVSEKKVLKPKKVVRKVVKKRRLVKGKVAAKDEEEPQSSEMSVPSVKVPTNRDVKSKEDVQNNGTALASDKGVNEMFTVSEEDIGEETVMGDSSNQDTREAKDLESPTDAVTLNSKEEIIIDDTDTTNKVLLLSENKVLEPKKVVRKVVKKRKLVKGKVVAKDEEEAQFSELPEPSVEVQTNQNLKNEENPDAKSIDNVNSSTAGRAMKKNPHQITDEVAVKFKQSEKNKQVGKEKAASKSENMDKAEPSEKHKSSDEQEIVGMIFMCSSKTKEDCYRYNIFGLPATKKESVLKIYEGMKLFLYDFRQKLLYGIYKAAGPGGYMIEPKAFHANYPSQVRFSIDNDCSPLPEAMFKKVIEDNYFTNTKFKAELNSKQVKSLCELFLVNKKGTRSGVNTATESPKLGIRPTVEGEKKKGTMSEVKTDTKSPKVGIRPTVELEKKRKAGAENEVNQGSKKRRVVVESERDVKRKRVVDDVKHAKGKDKVIRPRVNGDVSRPMAKGDVKRPRVENDARRLRLEDDTRHSRAEDARISRTNEDARRSRAKEDARRSRAREDARRFRANEEARRSRDNEDARRSRANEDARRSRAKDEERRLRREDEERRLRREDEERRVRLDDASRLQLEDDARRLQAENDARRLRAENDARFIRAEDDARLLRVEEDARRLLVEDRIHSPYTLNGRYSRLADAYERETYLPSTLPAPMHLGVVPPPIVPTYTSSYAYGRTSVLDDYRSDVTMGHEDRGLASSGLRPLYGHERLDPYLPYREPTDIRDSALGTRQIYSPPDPRDEYLPSTSRMSRYGVSPYRRY